MTEPKKRISEMSKETPMNVYIDRFWSKVDKSGDCWVWTGSRTHSGYGEFHNGYGRSRVASRFSFEITNGPIPDGMIICHKCDNPPCVNPDHLFLGTHKDNVLDMVSKKRYNSKHACRIRGNSRAESKSHPPNPRPRKLSMSCEYVRNYYKVPAEIGRRVTVGGKPGIIAEDRGHYIGVNFDDCKPGQIHNCHPTDNVEYLEKGLIRKLTRSQKRYRRYEKIADCFDSFRQFLKWDALPEDEKYPERELY